jgi:hypothetical protein
MGSLLASLSAPSPAFAVARMRGGDTLDMTRMSGGCRAFATL